MIKHIKSYSLMWFISKPNVTLKCWSSWNDSLWCGIPYKLETVRLRLKTSLRPTGTFISTFVNVDTFCSHHFESFFTSYKDIITKIISSLLDHMTHMIWFIWHESCHMTHSRCFSTESPFLHSNAPIISKHSVKSGHTTS